MTSTGEKQVAELRKQVKLREEELAEAKYYHRVLTVAFVTEARASGKTYEWIGKSLGVTATAIRRYYGRHNKQIGLRDYEKAREKFNIDFYTPGRRISRARTKLVRQPL